MVDFLVIGPFNAVTYSNIFSLIKDKRIRIGSSRVSEFTDGSLCNSIWFSNISVYCTPKLRLNKKYNECDYKKFDNYNAINVDRTEDIPVDYIDVMGVPLTFLEKWNPEEYRIVGYLNDGCFWDDNGLQGGTGLHMSSVNDKLKYVRLLIKKK